MDQCTYARRDQDGSPKCNDTWFRVCTEEKRALFDHDPSHKAFVGFVVILVVLFFCHSVLSENGPFWSDVPKQWIPID